jgi:hypothetical protein
MLGDEAAAAAVEVEAVSFDMSGFSPVSILGNRSGVLRLRGPDRSRKGEDRERLKSDGRKVGLEMTMRKDQIFRRSGSRC